MNMNSQAVAVSTRSQQALHRNASQGTRLTANSNVDLKNVKVSQVTSNKKLEPVLTRKRNASKQKLRTANSDLRLAQQQFSS